MLSSLDRIFGAWTIDDGQASTGNKVLVSFSALVALSLLSGSAVGLPSTAKPACEAWPGQGQCSRTPAKDDHVHQLYVKELKQVLLARLGLSSVPRRKHKAMSKPQREYLAKAMMSNDKATTTASTEQISNHVTEPMREILLSTAGPDYPNSRSPMTFEMPVCASGSCNYRTALLRVHMAASLQLRYAHVLFVVRGYPSQRLSTIVESRASDAWLSIDLRQIVHRWQKHRRFGRESMMIDMYCASCNSVELDENSTAYDASLLIDYVDTRGTLSQRKRRSASECSDAVNACCKRSRIVSFSDFGWDDWILSPMTIDLGYCAGSCSIREYQPANAHAKIMRSLRISRELGYGSSCCTPSKFTPVNLVYFDSFVVKQKLVDDLMVESCGCT